MADRATVARRANVSRWLIGAIALFCCCPAILADSDQRRGAYSHMEAGKLSEQLSAMGMFELLEAYAVELGDAEVAEKALVRGKMARVSGGGITAGERERLIDEAIFTLRRLCERAKPAEDADLLEEFRLRLQLIEAQGIVKARPLAVRLMYLQAGQGDRVELAKLTSPMVGQSEDLARSLDDALIDWRADLTKLVTILPELDSLAQQLRYKSAWVRFYYAMTLPVGDEKTRLLDKVISDVHVFASGDEGTQVKYWAALLTGMATRELGQHQVADRLLQAVASSKASSAVRLQAMFEVSRNLTEWGRYEQALVAAGQLKGVAIPLPERKRLEIEVQSAVLESYAHEKWAEAENENRNGAHSVARQRALLAFLKTHEGDAAITQAFLQMIAGRRDSSDDLHATSSLTLLAKATQQISDGGKEDPSGFAERRLRTVLARSDEVSVALHPEATWRLAVLMNDRRRNLEASRLFLQLAKSFPGHRLALRSAKNAVYSLNGVIEARRQAGLAIAANLREDFAAAIEVLLGKWSDREDLAKWHFDLGLQYETLAGRSDYELMAKGVEAYGRLGEQMDEYLQARHRSLELQFMLLEGPESYRPSAEELVSMLDGYSVSVGIAAKKEKDPHIARTMRNWGAMAEFRAAVIVYDMLGQEVLGLDRLRRAAERWADTDILPSVWEFEINKLLARERTDEAIKRVDAFSERYPDRGMSLMRLVVEQVRKRLEQMRLSSADQERLDAYRRAFDRFGEKLFADAQAKGIAGEQMYLVLQIRAQSMLAVGRAEEAIRLFQKAVAYDAQRRLQRQQEIDDEIDLKVRAARSIGGDLDFARTQADQYFAMIDKDKLSAAAQGVGIRLADALAFSDKAREDEDLQERLKVASDALVEALEDLRRRRKRAIATDAVNYLHLARAYGDMGQYGEALKHYRSLAAGIDVSKNPDLYWSVQLDRCACLLKAFGDDKDQLKRLEVLIRQLAMTDPQMGQLRDRFEAIVSKARLAGQQ